jgi:hypothetical protein
MAYNFNINPYLTTGVSPVSAGAPMTIAAWVRPTSLAASRSVGGVGQFPAAAPAIVHRNVMVVLASGAVRATAFTGTSGQADSTSTMSVNTWNHGAAVFTSLSSRTAYLNGGGSGTNTTTIASYNAFQECVVGAQLASTYATRFVGDIAEFGIWSEALTADEIASLAKGMTCDKVRPQNLVFYAPLVRDLIDYKGGLTITNNNTATVANHPQVYA